MNNPPSAIKNILFDLGGVILDLNVNKTLEGFLDLGFPKELLNYPENFHTDIFYKYETGKISTGEFRDAIRNYSGVSFSDKDFDEVWCSMLLRVPKQRTDILKKLSDSYRLYILSNTSPLHIAHFEKLFQATANYPLQDVFTKNYYSHEIGEHKPDEEAFHHVLNKAKILAGETLFLDDNIQNVKAAQALGFNTIHITQNLRMENVGFNL